MLLSGQSETKKFYVHFQIHGGMLYVYSYVNQPLHSHTVYMYVTLYTVRKYMHNVFTYDIQ